jgi:hypothetical protein
MVQQQTVICYKTENEKIPGDTPQLPKRSQREEFIHDLKLFGIALIVVAVICAIGYWKNG